MTTGLVVRVTSLSRRAPACLPMYSLRRSATPRGTLSISVIQCRSTRPSARCCTAMDIEESPEKSAEADDSSAWYTAVVSRRRSRDLACLAAQDEGCREHIRTWLHAAGAGVRCLEVIVGLPTGTGVELTVGESGSWCFHDCATIREQGKQIHTSSTNGKSI
jgi:hypothetical protein